MPGAERMLHVTLNNGCPSQVISLLCEKRCSRPDPPWAQQKAEWSGGGVALQGCLLSPSGRSVPRYYQRALDPLRSFPPHTQNGDHLQVTGRSNLVQVFVFDRKLQGTSGGGDRRCSGNLGGTRPRHQRREYLAWPCMNSEQEPISLCRQQSQTIMQDPGYVATDPTSCHVVHRTKNATMHVLAPVRTTRATTSALQ